MDHILVRNDVLSSQTGLAVNYTYDLDLSRLTGVAVQITYTDSTPVAVSFLNTAVSPASDTIIKASHGLFDGVVGQFTTTGTLPAGISALTNYYVIVVTSGIFKVASSLANAIAGTAIDITTQGTGTHTFTPTALAGNVFKLQSSNDGTNFSDISNGSVTIATNGTSLFNVAGAYYKTMRMLYIPSSGALNLTIQLAAKQ